MLSSCHAAIWLCCQPESTPVLQSWGHQRGASLLSEISRREAASAEPFSDQDEPEGSPRGRGRRRRPIQNFDSEPEISADSAAEVASLANAVERDSQASLAYKRPSVLSLDLTAIAWEPRCLVCPLAGLNQDTGKGPLTIIGLFILVAMRLEAGPQSQAQPMLLLNRRSIRLQQHKDCRWHS